MALKNLQEIQSTGSTTAKNTGNKITTSNSTQSTMSNAQKNASATYAVNNQFGIDSYAPAQTYTAPTTPTVVKPATTNQPTSYNSLASVPKVNTPMADNGGYNSTTPSTQSAIDAEKALRDAIATAQQNNKYVIDDYDVSTKTPVDTSKIVASETPYYPDYVKQDEPEKPKTYAGTNNNNSNPQLSSTSETDYSNFFNMIQQILADERSEREKLADANYKKLIALAERNFDSQRNAINRNNAYTQRWLNQQYGGSTSGAGLSQGLRAYTNMNNNLASARQNYNDALLNAETAKYNEMADAANSYTNNYNNYVVNPLMNLASSQGVIDDSFYRYIQKLGM